MWQTESSQRQTGFPKECPALFQVWVSYECPRDLVEWSLPAQQLPVHFSSKKQHPVFNLSLNTGKMNRTCNKAPRDNMATTTFPHVPYTTQAAEEIPLVGRSLYGIGQRPWSQRKTVCTAVPFNFYLLFCCFVPLGTKTEAPVRAWCPVSRSATALRHCSLLEIFLWRALWSYSVAPPTFWCHMKLLAQTQTLLPD